MRYFNELEKLFVDAEKPSVIMEALINYMVNQIATAKYCGISDSQIIEYTEKWSNKLVENVKLAISETIGQQ